MVEGHGVRGIEQPDRNEMGREGGREGRGDVCLTFYSAWSRIEHVFNTTTLAWSDDDALV